MNILLNDIGFLLGFGFGLLLGIWVGVFAYKAITEGLIKNG